MISHDCYFFWLGRPGKLVAQFADWHPDYLFKKTAPENESGGITDDQIHEFSWIIRAGFSGGA